MEVSRRHFLLLAGVSGLLNVARPRKAAAHGYKRNAVEIVHPWTADQKEPDGTLVVLMTLKNSATREDRLLRAESKVARKIGLVNADGSDLTGGLVVPPKGSVDLLRGGAHLRMFDLNKRLQAYDTLPVALCFEKAGRIAIDVLVEERM